MRTAYNNLEMVVRSNSGVVDKKQLILQFMDLFVPHGVLEGVYQTFRTEE